MRLVGVAMVRNEADIVEAFVRHNDALIDSLTVVDHGSVDGTAEILAALAAEGLALRIESESDLAQRQPEVLTRAAREAFARGADVVFPLDADEFLKIPNRALLERVTGDLPAGLNAALHWQTYVPESACPPSRPLEVARRRVAVERHGLNKVVLTHAFANDASAMLGPGSHTLVSARDAPCRLARFRPDVATLAHLPVRSSEQLIRKISVGWLAHRAAHRLNADLAFHWRDLYEKLARDGPQSFADIRTIAANYGVSAERFLPLGAVELVEDPLPAGIVARYGHLAPRDADARVRAFAERLARSIAS